MDMIHFNEESEARTIKTLSEQFTHLLFDKFNRTITVAELFQLITNDTTCNIQLVKQALQQSIDRKDVLLVSKDSRQHRVATAAPDYATIELIQKPLILI